MDKTPTHIDLFSGIGGFALAAQWAGFRTIAFCEIDKYCQKVLAKNFLENSQRNGSGSRRAEYEGQFRTSSPVGASPSIHANIFDFDGTAFRGCDLLTGGFPCQPFSVAGKRRGAADDRAIWPEMLRVIKEARPAWVLGENVPGIIPMELDNVLSDLESIGYATRPFVIPACAVDARHRRDRLWIVCHATEQGFPNRTSIPMGRNGELQPKFERSGCSVSNSGSAGLEGQRQVAVRTGTQLNNAGDHCRWEPEPDVRGMVDGLSEKLVGGLDASQRLDSKSNSFAHENLLRNMWTLILAKSSSYRQQSVKQLAIEFADALCRVSHETSLEKRQEAMEASFSYLCGLRQACETLGTVRNSSDSLPQIWKSMSREETDWAHMAACSGCFHSEWPETTRVAHGIPKRVDRLKGLGNAIVPQVAYEILLEIRKLI